MNDIFKSEDEIQREEKINNLFKSAGNLKKEELEVLPEEETVSAAETGKKSWKILLNILTLALFLGLAAAAGYFFWQYKKAAKISDTASVSDETEIVEEKVGALMELSEEKPAITTVTDQEKIISQPFFAKALEGDKILLYIQSQKVILYRPSSNEVINSASLFSESASETEARIAKACAASNAPKQGEKIENKVKVDVLNGTEIKGFARETADKLSGMENVELAKVDNAQKSAYLKILVVDLSGKNATPAGIIAQKLGGEVGSLPEGENKGTADILVIAGKE